MNELSFDDSFFFLTNNLDPINKTNILKRRMDLSLQFIIILTSRFNKYKHESRIFTPKGYPIKVTFFYPCTSSREHYKS